MNKTSKNIDIVIIGSTSHIAKSYIKKTIEELSPDYHINFDLFSRSESSTNIFENEPSSENFTFMNYQIDILCPKQIENCLQEIEKIDKALVFQGSLTDNEKSTNLNYLREQLDVNLTSYILWSEKIVKFFEKQTFGHLILIGSVAGDRARKKNYIYGTSKASIEFYIKGLNHRFFSYEEVFFTLVKPGLIDTPMTKDFEKGLIWSTADKVAEDITQAIKRKKFLVYTPNYWRFIMFVIRNLPNIIFNRTNF